MHFERRDIDRDFDNNFSRAFGNVMNFYTTQGKITAGVSFFGACYKMFDYFLDLAYMAGTNFN